MHFLESWLFKYTHFKTSSFSYLNLNITSILITQALKSPDWAQQSYIYKTDNKKNVE